MADQLEALRRQLRDIGHALRARRTELGWSIQHLADQTSVSTAMISLVERGLAVPSLATLNGLAHPLGLSLGGLFAVPSVARHARLEGIEIDPGGQFVAPSGPAVIVVVAGGVRALMGGSDRVVAVGEVLPIEETVPCELHNESRESAVLLWVAVADFAVDADRGDVSAPAAG